MVDLTLFNKVFKAFNLFWNKYVALIHLPGNGIRLLSIPQRLYTEFWHGLALVINITKCIKKRELQLTVACNSAFLLKPCIWQALFSFHHSEKHAPPHLSSSLSGQYGDQGSTLAIKSLYFSITAATVLYVSLTSEKTEKGNGLQSIEIHRRVVAKKSLWYMYQYVMCPSVPLK